MNKFMKWLMRPKYIIRILIEKEDKKETNLIMGLGKKDKEENVLGILEDKESIKAIMEKRIYQNYEVIATKILRSPKDFIRYNKRTYIVDWEHPCYTSFNMKVYHINYESGKYISFIESKFGANPKAIDKIVSSNVLERLARGVMNLKKEKIMYFILGIIMGALLGAIIMSEYKNQTITELYERLENTNPVIFEMIKSSLMLL